MGVESISSLPPDIAVATEAPGGEMGRDAFLKMLVVQMQNQDPTKPMDNGQMTAQLAQFSALEQAVQMTSQVELLNNKFDVFQQGTAAAVSLASSGKPVVLELNNGDDDVVGVLEKVQWINGDTQFVVDGQAYSAGSVRSLRVDESQAGTTE